MRTIVFLALAGVSLTAAPLLAQQSTKPATANTPPAARDHPAASAVASVTVQATVEAVDLKTREVTLRRDDGELVTLVVGEEARNLPQLAKGDVVTANYEVGLVVALGPPGDAPVRVDDTQLARTPAGQKPGGSIQQTIAVTATVVGIDTGTRTVTLKGPKQTLSLPVSKDIDLAKVKVGDQVSAVYRESFALTVEPAKKAKTK
jgi:Cu/Ag efflux protein CusF